MKKVIYSILIVFVTINSAYSGWWDVEGNGNVTTKERKIGDVSGIVLKTVGNVYIKQGTATYFRIDTDENIHEYIKIKNDDNKLVIYTNKPVKPTKLNIFITLKDCNDIILDGSGNIEFVGKLKTENCFVDINGSGDVEMENVVSPNTKITLDGTGDIYFKQLKSQKTNIQVAGSGDIRIIGNSDVCNVKIMGSGDLDLDDFKVNYFYAEILGSGDISINANKSLKAKVLGSGDILYTGEPEEIKLESIGSGSIRKK
jgi:hypothetical protein